MQLPTYHIFSGFFRDIDVMWLEAVEGLGAANERMRAIAAEKPGPYFIFSMATNSVFGSIDTSIQRGIKARRESA
jgi:hypothetical protein